MSKTTTFPLTWNQVKMMESKLLVEFLNQPTPSTSFDLLQISLGCRFGLRVSDLLQLKWNNLINLDEGDELILVEKKTNKIRRIRFSKQVHLIVSTVINNISVSPSDYIFTSQKGKGQRPMSIQGFNRRLKNTLERLKIKYRGNPSSHCLRKTTIVEMIRKGFKEGDSLSLLKVSQLINHSSVNQTIKYTNYDKSISMSLYDLD